MLSRWVIAGVTALILLIGSRLTGREAFRWFKQLRRPNWLVFEPLIPLIWTAIFICGAISAMIVWEQDAVLSEKILLMILYALVAALTVSYTPVLAGLKSIRGGLILGAAATVLAWLLALLVWRIDNLAALLLLPYALWGPIGTYVTWELLKLNPEA